MVCGTLTLLSYKFPYAQFILTHLREFNDLQKIYIFVVFQAAVITKLLLYLEIYSDTFLGMFINTLENTILWPYKWRNNLYEVRRANL